MRLVRAPACLIALVLFGGSACGIDGIFFTPRDFEPTEAPRSILVGDAVALATISVMSQDGKIVASGAADAAGRFTIALPPEADGSNLRLLAVAEGRSTKAVLHAAPRGETTEVGALDARSTAYAQLATYEVTAEAGSSFPATPSVAVRELLKAMATNETAALAELRQMIGGLLAAPAGSNLPFDLTGYALSEAFVTERGLDAKTIADYRGALAAAAADYGIEIRCDPSKLSAMFAVDASGRGRDGNGAPQLIRQPTKDGKIYLGFTADETSSVNDDSIPTRLVPNDPAYTMTDDGADGDEVAGDGIYTVVVPLPRGARIQYKYTNGSAGEGFTGAEEWPGNARILEVQDVLTGRPDGKPDCILVRRDTFGDEASNKNFVNLNTVAKKRGGTVSFEADLGGGEVAEGAESAKLGGLSLLDVRSAGTLTPLGVPEARENGVCQICPAPLILDPDDDTPPKLLDAERLSLSRVRLRFSEPIRGDDARDASRFQYLDASGISVPVVRTTPSGSDVIMEVAPTHPTSEARVNVRELRDVSAAGNTLAEAAVKVGLDRTAPKVVSVLARSFRDIDPDAAVDDPKVGQVVDVIFDEAPEISAASDPARFLIDGLEVIAAIAVDGAPAPTVRLVTAAQTRGLQYNLRLVGVRDPAGNALEQEAPFDAFGLYDVRFGVVPGFAFASSDGSRRGLPLGSKLYLTGTPLAAARDLQGRSLSILERGGSRTDVTGWPQFELTPSTELHAGQPIYTIDLLLPKGSWAWKAAHGVEGEHSTPPTTLEKVYKVLVSTNDATGVRVDPVTMRAANGVEYINARLSETGEDPPRRDVIFKREAPDEVCEVVNRAVTCPFIVVGTWRDLVLEQGRTVDYDDGIIALPPHRPGLPDFSAPKLLDARVRDSYSVQLSFDERLADPATRLEVALANADDGIGLPVRVLSTNEVKAHQAILVIEGGQHLADGLAYTVRYRGATDAGGRAERRWGSATVLAPDQHTPLRPLSDTEAPRVLGVDATDLTELIVRFDEALDPSSAAADKFDIANAGTGAALLVSAAELTADRQGIRLTTERQQILEGYRLTATGLADIADPPNTLTSTTVAFVGFGERVPPTVERVRAVDRDRVLVRFDEPIDAATALTVGNYQIGGLTIRNVAFSGDPARRSLAFKPSAAPKIRDTVVLTTAAMTAGASYALGVSGVQDLSGNPAQTASVAFAGVDAPPTVDVIIEYQVSDAVKVAGRVPSRAISPAALDDSREGLFVVGARAATDHAPVAGVDGPGNDALGGFPAEGQPLDGIEPRMRDDGTGADLVAGDAVFSIEVPDVPLGTTLIWKAFAPFTVGYRDRNVADTAAAFADALPGPSAFADGQEFPGNENGALILDEGAVPGRVRIRCLFGDEISFKKHTGGAAFIWVSGDR